MIESKNDIEYSRSKIADLKPHPRQADLFGDLPEHELQQLAESIKRDGLNQAIEILPDGTIVCGHQRFLAVQLLGWNEVEVVIRYDLAVAGEAAVEGRLIEDNLIRRQLTPLQRVRCAAMLAGDLPRWSRHGRIDPRARKRVAVQLGVSTKTADRFLRIAACPREVQEAYDQSHLSQVAASRVYSLSPGQQADFAEELKAVGIANARSVFKRFFQLEPTRFEHYRRLIHAIAQALAALEGHLADIDFAGWNADADAEILIGGQRLLADLHKLVAQSSSTGHGVQLARTGMDDHR